MDLKGQLVDTTIQIKPSHKLLKYLRSISYQNGMPNNITKIVKSEVGKATKSSCEEKTKVDLKLSEEDLALLAKLKAKHGNEGDEINNKISDKEDDNKENEVGNKTNSKKSKQKDPEMNAESLHLTVSDIDWLYGYLTELRSGDKDAPYLHELLQGSEVVTPENAVLKRNPDLEARCVKLRAQQEAREYRAMTRGVDNVRIRFPEDSISYQLKQLNRQLIAVGQFLLSIFAGFLFGFKGIELMIGGLDFGFRLLLGVMCALIIAIAEIYFLAKKLNEELTIPETTQLGGPPKFADQPDTPKMTSVKKGIKEHKD